MPSQKIDGSFILDTSLWDVIVLCVPESLKVASRDYCSCVLSDCELLQAADLSTVLADPEAELTVLAPVDSAFAVIPPEDIKLLLATEPALIEVCIHSYQYLSQLEKKHWTVVHARSAWGKHKHACEACDCS
jgi:hypothetical protein